MFTSISPFSRSFLLVLLGAALITACNSSDTTSSVDTGDVALLITDNPTSAYDEINVVAEQVSLVGEGLGHEAHLMTKTVTFNLLDLRNTFRRLSKCKAPVGTYNKVRFRIKDVELVKYSYDKNGKETRHSNKAHLKKKLIDLTARKQFAVSRHHKLVVKLDLDADKSLVTDPATEEPVLDPVTKDPVFDPDATVDTDEVPTDTPPQEVTPVLMNELGDVRNLQTDSFDLCNTNPDQSVDCIQVNVNLDTVVMNPALARVTTGISGINETFQWKVFGHLDVITDTINALHVIEHRSQHRTYSGTLEVVNDQIGLRVSDTTSYPVTIDSDNLPGVYDSAGNVLDVNALGAGVNVEVIGMLGLTGSLKPGVIIIPIPVP